MNAELGRSQPWDEPAWRIKSDSPRTAQYRRLQGWYRETQLGIAQAGIGVNGKRVVSMLPSEAIDEHPDLNFICPAAYDHAVARIAVAESEGLNIEPDRLRRNMLSSMPLCFNIFGALGTHPSFIQLVQALFDQSATEIIDVQCEWAPRPISNYLSDYSAFDAFVEYLDSDGQRCFLGVETKYTEPFSTKRYDTQRYRAVTQDSGWFIDGAADVLVDPTSNQLWRTAMLAARMVSRGDFARGRVVLLSLDDDVRATIAARALREQLIDPHNFIHLTYEQLTQSAGTTPDPELRQWAERFRTRYLHPDDERLPEAVTSTGGKPLPVVDRRFEPDLDVSPHV